MSGLFDLDRYAIDARTSRVLMAALSVGRYREIGLPEVSILSESSNKLGSRRRGCVVELEAVGANIEDGVLPDPDPESVWVVVVVVEMGIEYMIYAVARRDVLLSAHKVAMDVVVEENR